MVQENEFVTLLLGIGTLIFVIAFLPRLRMLPHPGWLILILGGQALAWLFTILETWAFPILFNDIEHFGYALSAVSLLVWVVLALHSLRERA